MKKLMALCLSVLMALSMCSFTVMAEGEVDFSAIANGQPQNFVVSNLDTTTYSITTSSDTAVIALDGTVNRPLLEDATVSLTIDGGTAFDVTVKAQTSNVLYSTDFTTDAVASAVTGNSSRKFDFEGYPEWYIAGKNSGGTAMSGGKLNANHTDDAYDDDESTAADRLYLYHTLATPENEEPVTITFDVSDISSDATTLDVRINGRYCDEEGAQVGTLEALTVARLTSSGYGQYWMGSYKKSGVSIKYDPMTGEFWGNGVRYSKTNGDGDELNLLGCYYYNVDKSSGEITRKDAPETATKVILTSIFFVDGSGSAVGTYSIDNFVEYQDKSVLEILENDATKEEKISYLTEYLNPEKFAGGQSLASVSSNLDLFSFESDDVSLVWTTSDANVIAADGTITKDATLPKSAVITGTVKVDSLDEVTRTYTVNVVPEGTEMFVGTKNENMNWDFEDKTAGTTSSGEGWYEGGIKEINPSAGTTLTYKNDAQRGMIAEYTAESGGDLLFYSGTRSGDHASRYIAGFDYKFSVADEAADYSIEYFLRGNNSGTTNVKLTKDTDSTETDTSITMGQSNSSETSTCVVTKNVQIWTNKLAGFKDIYAPDVWHSLAIDYNSMTNLFLVYVDGMLVSKIPSATMQIAGTPMMWIQLTTKNLDTVQIDNHYVVKYSNNDVVKADAALKEAVYNAASRETGQSGRPGAYRIIDNADLNTVIITSVPTPSEAHGATLSWKVNNAVHTGDTFGNATKAVNANFEVTAASGDVTLTTEFTSKFAPAEILSMSCIKKDEGGEYPVGYMTGITIEGTLEGKTLIAMAQDETGKVVDLSVIPVTTADTTITFEEEDYIHYDGASFYVLDNGTLTPIVFSG